jgi:hypothetical protein
MEQTTTTSFDAIDNPFSGVKTAGMWVPTLSLYLESSKAYIYVAQAVSARTSSRLQ